MFSYQVRVLACAHCGAPLHVALEGGQFPCQFCQTVNQVACRSEAADLGQAQQAQQVLLSESERYARLREQAHRPVDLPTTVARYCIGSELAQDQVEPAVGEWVAARSELLAGAPFTAAEHLFFLTILLSPKLDAARRRALLETAVEVLADPHQRQIVRRHLVHCAVLDGDLASAEEWLRPCNPRSADLQADTAYRVATSLVHTAFNRPQEVLKLLSGQPGEVPIADGQDATAAVLRANALERMGRGAEARTQLGELLRARPTGFGDALEVFQTNQALGLCPGSRSSVCTPVWEETERKLRPNPGGGELGGIGALALIAIAGFSVPIARITGVLSAAWTHSIAGSGPHASPEGFIMFCTMAGLAALVGLVFWLRSYVRAKQLRARGVMTLARLISVKDVPSGQAGNRFFTLGFETVPSAGTPQSPTRFTYTRSLANAPRAGMYSILLDPVDPSRSRVNLS